MGNKWMIDDRTRVAIQIIASVFAGTAALKTLVWPYVENYAFATPAVIVKSATVSFSKGQDQGTVRLLLDKIRPCLPKSAVLFYKDFDGVDVTVDLEWKVPLRMGINLSPVFSFKTPYSVDVLHVHEIGLQISHYQCDDGPDPKQPVMFDVDKELVNRR